MAEQGFELGLSGCKAQGVLVEPCCLWASYRSSLSPGGCIRTDGWCCGGPRLLSLLSEKRPRGTPSSVSPGQEIPVNCIFDRDALLVSSPVGD